MLYKVHIILPSNTLNSSLELFTFSGELPAFLLGWLHHTRSSRRRQGHHTKRPSAFICIRSMPWHWQPTTESPMPSYWKRQLFQSSHIRDPVRLEKKYAFVAVRWWASASWTCNYVSSPQLNWKAEKMISFLWIKKRSFFTFQSLGISKSRNYLKCVLLWGEFKKILW